MGYALSNGLCGELQEHIRRRTGRRVRDLSIDLEAERVILRGRTPSYYVKQLAQQSVRDLLPDVRLENVIIVEAPSAGE